MTEYATGNTGSIGTVTLLLANVGRNTKSWEEDPAAMRAAHSRYEEILQGAIEANGGFAYQTIGNASQVAFPTASQALQAAIDAQLLLFTEQWPPSIGELQVGMAVHTGVIEGSVGASARSGPTLNRATGLLSAGHGGQVLLSAATRELALDRLSQLKPTDPPGVQLLDLGEHRLNDLSRGEHIYQLVVPGLPTHFPALRTLEGLPNNLPRQSTPLIGREKQTADVIALLHRSDVSLVTLTGPAGTGKTRLSLRVGAQMLEEHKDGVWFVELATLSRDEHKLVPSSIAETLGVREVRGQAVIETLKDYLKDKQMLLVLDNFEQVTSAASQVSSLLKAALHLKVLVSSRIALKVYGEREYRVPPLSMPDPKLLLKNKQEHKGERHLDPSFAGSGPNEQTARHVEQYTRYEAVRLFVDRCQAVKADFEITTDNAPDVASICARLDGLPLAIELAAARIRMFTPQALLGRLSDRLKILTGGAKDLPARQQTMRGAIEWSYDLLSEEEKLLFRRMAIFNGGRTLEAIEIVCQLRISDFGMRIDSPSHNPQSPIHNPQSYDVVDIVQSLLDKSLLVEREGSDGEIRYWMLETIHEYAREKLQESGEEEVLGRAHALYFMKLAEEAEPGLIGDNQAHWLNRLEDEHDNLRAALRWAHTGEVDERGDGEEGGDTQEAGATDRAEIGLRIAGAISQFWLTRGYFSEGREQLDGLLSSSTSLPPFSRPGRDTLPTARYSRRAKAHNVAGMLAHRQGEYAAARTALEQGLALAREIGDKPSMARSLNILGNLADGQGDYQTARSLYEQSLALFRELGDRSGIANALGNLGNVAVSQADYATARPLYEQSLVLDRELGNKRGVAISLLNLGDLAYAQGDYAAAGSLYEQGLTHFREIDDKLGTAISLNDLGSVADGRGDYQTARALYDESLVIFQELGDKRGIAATFNASGAAACTQGDYAAAGSLYEQGLTHFKEMEDKRGIAVSLMGLGAIAVMLGAAGGTEGTNRVEAAQRGTRLLGASEDLLESIGAVLEAVDRVLYEKGVASARLQLGDPPFEKTRHEGQAMSMEAAIEYALQPIVYEPSLTRVHEVQAERPRRVDELHIAINQAKKAQQVEAIVGTEYFIELQAKARALLVARQERGAGNGSTIA